MENQYYLAERAAKLRYLLVKALHGAGSGHPGGSLSCADVMTYLYFDKMNVSPDKAKDPDRDRFVLSKGHACPALYSALAMRGYFPEEELWGLRKSSSVLQGHPDMVRIAGVDMTTGSLGQGVSAACGIALAGKADGRAYKVYTILGDGEIQEGQVWEAAMFASHYKLSNLCVILDWNGLQIDGPVAEVMNPTPHDKKFEAFGFNVISIDGHNLDEIEAAFKAARACTDRPTAIIAKTVKGKGVSFMENEAGWHGNAPNAEQYETAKAELEAALAALN